MQTHREELDVGGGKRVSYSGLRDVWGPRRRSKNIKYTRMHHLKNSKNFSPEGPHENVSSGPVETVDGSADIKQLHSNFFWDSTPTLRNTVCNMIELTFRLVERDFQPNMKK